MKENKRLDAKLPRDIFVGTKGISQPRIQNEGKEENKRVENKRKKERKIESMV